MRMTVNSAVELATYWASISPVVTGTYRHNVGTAGPDRVFVSSPKQTYRRRRTLAELRRPIASVPFGQDIAVGNSAPYAEEVEKRHFTRQRAVAAAPDILEGIEVLS